MRLVRYVLMFLPIPFLMLLTLHMPAGAGEVVRIAVLKFGTVNWEVEVIRRRCFDESNGFRLEPVELASNEAGRIAILAGEVDVIASDWLFVARQRGEGRAWTYLPYSSAIGGIMVPDPISSLEHLRGATIGVAGGRLDKTWLGLLGLARADVVIKSAEICQLRSLLQRLETQSPAFPEGSINHQVGRTCASCLAGGAHKSGIGKG